jgi:hypothetical protein
MSNGNREKTVNERSSLGILMVITLSSNRRSLEQLLKNEIFGNYSRGGGLKDPQREPKGDSEPQPCDEGACPLWTQYGQSSLRDDPIAIGRRLGEF